MRKFAPLLWIVVIVLAAFGLYRVKYEVKNIKSQIAATQQQLESQRELLHVVAAEWAYLNRPDRLQMLSAKYLSSASLTVDQIADLQAIPFPSTATASLDVPSDISPASFQPAASTIEDGDGQ